MTGNMTFKLELLALKKFESENLALHPLTTHVGHGIPFERVQAAIQRRIGRTRFAHFTKAAGEPGGTVSLGTGLYMYWAIAGG